MKNTIKAGLVALTASGAFGTAAIAQNSLSDLPFAPDSVVNILSARGVSFDSLVFTTPQTRDMLGESHCYDRDRNGVADTHSWGAPIRGDDNLYTLVIVTGNGADDVSGVHGVSREVAFGLMEQERYATGLLQNEEGRIVNVYSMNNGTIRVARSGAINPIEQSSSIVLCADVRVPRRN